MKSQRVIRSAIGAVLVGALGWLAYAHMDQSVELRFGLFTLHDVPLPIVMYGALVVGMLAMVGVSLRNDLRVRQALKRYDKIAADVLADVESDDLSAEEVNKRT